MLFPSIFFADEIIPGLTRHLITHAPYLISRVQRMEQVSKTAKDKHKMGWEGESWKAGVQDLKHTHTHTQLLQKKMTHGSGKVWYKPHWALP